MTKKSVLKLATAALLFFFGVSTVNSQILTDYENVAETVYQTAGKDFRLYVLPDAVYNPGYNPLTNEGLGLNSRWAWAWTLDGSPEGTQAAANLNYVEMTAPAVGSYVFTVVETNTAFACDDGGTTKNVEVIAAPTATILTDDITDQCGDMPAEDIIIQISENVPQALAAYSFRITRLIQTIDLSDLEIDEITSDNLADFPLNNKVADGDPGFAWGAGGVHTFTIASDDLDIVNGERTRYTYTLETVEAGVTGNGIVSAISQKSDYLSAQVNGNAFGAKTVLEFIVNPTPATGPIYHIPNDFAL